MSWIITDDSGVSDLWTSLIEDLREEYLSALEMIFLEKQITGSPSRLAAQVRLGICQEWSNTENGAGAVVIFIGSLDSAAPSGWGVFYRSCEGKVLNLHPQSTEKDPFKRYFISQDDPEPHKANMALGSYLKAATDSLLKEQEYSAGPVFF
ncbi:hypothetical protein [Rothia terrae]|uniref:Uncharacterized protein n=1 Tax=Rothia terrae TaxID=396015 RepID=A0A7S6WX42_9MICC|nr:hypothetical protein [Rothia terrae]QOW64709.1 hypothetical protein IDM49_11440 [Rothia terrae]